MFSTEPPHKLLARFRDAHDYYAMYGNGFYVNIDRTTKEFYWDHELDRYIIALSDSVVANALRMSSDEIDINLRYSFCQNSGSVLDHLQDPKIKPESWVTKEVRDIYEGLLNEGYAFTTEAWSEEGKLVGGMFGIALGSIVTLDTMYGVTPIYRSASKGALCYALAQFYQAGIEIVDVEVKHSADHPAARLGETKMSFSEFRSLLLKLGRTGPNKLFAYLAGSTS